MTAPSVKTRLLAALLLTAVLLPTGGAWAADKRPAQPIVRNLLAASGVAPDQLDHYADVLDRLARTIHHAHRAGGDARSRARAVHAFLHQHALRGTYEPGASDLGVALDGGPFNCAAASALFLVLATECGVDAHTVAVRGHVWCRVGQGGKTFDVETTCRNWFEIADRYAGLSTENVSAAMAAHRRRAGRGQVLSERQFLAIFHFNRGVTLLRQSRFDAAALANLRALILDPLCRPAYENLLAAVNNYAASAANDGHVRSGLVLLTVGLALQGKSAPAAAN